MKTPQVVVVAASAGTAVVPGMKPKPVTVIAAARRSAVRRLMTVDLNDLEFFQMGTSFRDKFL